MSRERLDEIEARAKAATRGPWRVRAMSVRACESQTVAWDIAQRPDRDFIAAAREDVPWLVAQVRERDAEIARLREELGSRLGEGSSALKIVATDIHGNPVKCRCGAFGHERCRRKETVDDVSFCCCVAGEPEASDA